MNLGHPSGLKLSRFVDGDLPTVRLEKIALHLETCGECRERVEFIRALGATSTELEFGPPPDVADEVLRRRRAEERVDLLADEEASEATPAVPWMARFGIAASIALAALVGGYMLLAPPAGAHRSVLSFDPGTPSSGETVSLTYEPASYLAHHDSLRLRMRARNAESPNPRGGVIGELRVSTLRKNDDGVFEGRFALQPGDLYVAAAVEDFTGENIDTNFGQLWDVLIAEEDGEPSIAALESKYRVLEPFNWILAAEWAAEAAERYPQNPFGWTMLYVHQSRLGTVSLSDSLAAVHEGKLRELVELADTYDADELYWLADYARRQGQLDLRERLLDRLRERAPQHRAIAEQQVALIVAETGGDLAKRLERLESLWSANSNSALLVRQGILAAAQTGNTARLDAWIERARRVPELSETAAIGLLAPFNDLVSQRLRLRADWLQKLEDTDDSLRSLRTPISEYRQSFSDSVEVTRIKLAGDLLIRGDTAQALAVMADVAEKAWKPEVLQPYVDELLAVGDTATARPIIGMLYADPVVREHARAKYASILSIDVSDVAAAEAEYRNRVRESTTPARAVPQGMRLELISGGELVARDLRGKPTVLLMWDPRLIDGTRLLADFQRWSDRLRSEGINSLIVTRFDVNRQSSTERKIVYDRGYELSQIFGEFEVPRYVVLDAELTVVAHAPDTATALRFAHAFLTPN